MSCTKNGKKRKNINEHLANSKHPETNVPFDNDGFPIFDVRAEVILKTDDLRKTRTSHNRICSHMLYEKEKKSGKFLQEELDSLEAGLAPDGYTWHHHQDEGRMQLVPEDPDHKGTGHTGGYSIWGRNAK